MICITILYQNGNKEELFGKFDRMLYINNLMFIFI